MKKILPLTYEPKIQPVRNYTCTQTIRIINSEARWKVNDWISFHGWSGKSRHSKWSWRTPYMRVNEVILLFAKKEGFELQNWDNSYEPDWYAWNSGYANYLAKLDAIIPPKGIELRELLFKMHNLFKSRMEMPYYKFQVIRWDKPLEQMKIVEE